MASISPVPAAGLTFYLGAPEPSWLSRPQTAGVALLVSHPRLSRLRTLQPRPAHWAPYAIDSGGYNKITRYGRWPFTARQYAADIRRAIDHIGARPAFVAPMDWMCEDAALSSTGLTVAEHQRLTLENYLELRMLEPGIPWAPVLQGWTGGQYERHIDAYQAAGIALDRLERVGVGSVCRRQNMIGASLLIDRIARHGIRIHAFGYKVTGLVSSAAQLASADSMAWVTRAHHEPPLPGCTHARCTYCLRYALAWWQEVRDTVTAAHPGLLLDLGQRHPAA
ncbi:hypothetical protein AGRA3207_007512 [Actinomadura graeca]|uniref:DeoxyPurine in DNA protein A domain-containing protein n=1 Tax=Actinomadura graeca TaxID=2750812 RepID=A0ABX8RAD6_9ACTN|nr:hypothetical protein [Actinomadura graeca]QXJ25943.1 hypothetical protein AGRA3207_007512 [Actinomadura graeca]